MQLSLAFFTLFLMLLSMLFTAFITAISNKFASIAFLQRDVIYFSDAAFSTNIFVYRCHSCSAHF
jgi:hypothetical protein